MVDPGWLERINGTMICLTCAMLCHALRALQTGIHKKPLDFRHDVVGGKVSESWSVLSRTKIANGSRKMQDLFARQKHTWWGFEKATQDLFILNLRPTITQRLEKQHSVRHERREGFMADNNTLYAELQRLLAMSTQGQTSRSRRMPFDLRVQDPVAQNSQDLSQEKDTSIDSWESRSLDSDLASEDQQRVEPEGESEETHNPDPSHFSLSLEESQASEGPSGENMHSKRDTKSQQDDPDAKSAIRGRVQLGGFLICKVIEIDLVS